LIAVRKGVFKHFTNPLTMFGANDAPFALARGLDAAASASDARREEGRRMSFGGVCRAKEQNGKGLTGGAGSI
jgi:hypothetical protein